jgi:hypothetical protein
VEQQALRYPELILLPLPLADYLPQQEPPEYQESVAWQYLEREAI